MGTALGLDWCMHHCINAPLREFAQSLMLRHFPDNSAWIRSGACAPMHHMHQAARIGRCCRDMMHLMHMDACINLISARSGLSAWY